jgi:hypothetical protein
MALEQWSETVRLEVKPLPTLQQLEAETKAYYARKNGNTNVNKKMVKAYIRHKYTNYKYIGYALSNKRGLWSCLYHDQGKTKGTD